MKNRFLTLLLRVKSIVSSELVGTLGVGRKISLGCLEKIGLGERLFMTKRENKVITGMVLGEVGS